MTGSSRRLKVLSVTGAGRSGTTVLAGILDGVEGFASAGELRRLWERGVAEQRPCGCGEIPARCPVWGPVIARSLATADAGRDVSPLQQIIDAQREVSQWRHRVRVLRSARGGDDSWEALRQVRAAMGAACAAFAESTGAHVMVDTSKRAEDAAVIAALPGVDQYVLHIVRDPRAVAHSWRHAKTYVAAGTTRTMHSRRAPSTVSRWIENSLGTELLLMQLPRTRWLRVRYEDFAREPRAVVDTILAFLDECGEAPFDSDNTVRLDANHIVAGNPSRFTTGAVQIRTDEQWLRRMPRRDQWLVELATKPLMLRYGYGRNRT